MILFASTVPFPRLERYSLMLRTVTDVVEAIANRARRYTMPGMPA